MLIEIQYTTLLQIFYEFVISSKVIFKSLSGLEIFCQDLHGRNKGTRKTSLSIVADSRFEMTV